MKPWTSRSSKGRRSLIITYPAGCAWQCCTRWLSNHALHPDPAACLPAYLPLAFLYPYPQLVDLFRSYFEGALNENSVKRNFVLIYELLDETMDFGFPQLTGVWVWEGGEHRLNGQGWIASHIRLRLLHSCTTPLCCQLVCMWQVAGSE